MDKGYIKLFRKMTDWKWYTHETTFRVFIHLLFKANWEDKNGLKRGQVFTNWKKIATELKIFDKKNKPSRQPVRTALNNLKSTNDITIKKTNKGSIITINNYNNYQDLTNKLTNKNGKINQQPNQQPNQLITKEEKEEKNNIYIYYIPTQNEILEQLTIYDLPGDKLLNYATEFQSFVYKHGAKLKIEWKELLERWMKELKHVKEKQSGL